MKSLVTSKKMPIASTSGSVLNLSNLAPMNYRVNSVSGKLNVLHGPINDPDAADRNFTVFSRLGGVDSPLIQTRAEQFADKWLSWTYNISSSFSSETFSLTGYWIYSGTTTGEAYFVSLGNDISRINIDITADFKVPTVNNINISQNDPRQSTAITWDADIQDLADVQIWQDGVLKTTIATTTTKSVVMPANTISAGAFTVTVIATNNPLEDLGTTGTASSAFSATMVLPTVSGGFVNQTEIRLPIITSWASTLQTNYKVEFIQESAVKATLTGTTATSATLTSNSLAELPTIARITVYNTVNGVSTSATQDVSFSATVSRPVITSLEPNGLNQNINQPITVTWASSLQESYTLVVKQDNAVLQTYTGTTATSLVIPNDTAKSGDVVLELTCRNVVNEVTATASRTSTFSGYGKPELPILNAKTVYNEAKPVFTWTAPEQVAYEFEIYYEGALYESSSTVVTVNKSYTTVNILLNNKDYTIKVRVKNQYDLWSDWASKVVSISYVELQKPTISTVSADGSILVNGLCAGEIEFSRSEVWRYTEDDKIWRRIGTDFGNVISVNDTTVASGQEYIYKIRAYSTTGGIIESDFSTNVSYLKYVMLEDIQTGEVVALPYLINLDFKLIVDIVARTYAGVNSPRIHKSDLQYEVANLSVAKDKTNEIKLKNLITHADVLLLRDKKGNKMYCSLSSGIGHGAKQNVTYNDISFELTEIAFIEQDMFTGTTKFKLTYFDGTWLFDGTIDFSGTYTMEG